MRQAATAGSTATTTPCSRGARTTPSASCPVQATRPPRAAAGIVCRSTRGRRGRRRPSPRGGPWRARAPSTTRSASSRTSSSPSSGITPPPAARRIASLSARRIPLPASSTPTSAIAERGGRAVWSPPARPRMIARCLAPETRQTRTAAVGLGGSKCTNTLRDCKGSVFNGLYSLFTCFISIRIICTIRFCLVSSVVTYLPALTFVNHLVRYSLSLIYEGIRLYARVTNLGPEGKQTLQ